MTGNGNRQEKKIMMFVSSVCLIMVIGNIVFGSTREDGTVILIKGLTNLTDAEIAVLQNDTVNDVALRTSKKHRPKYSFPTTARFSNNHTSLSFAANAATSTTVVDDHYEYVLKVVTSYQKFGVLDREVCILEHLSSFSWAPQLVWYNSTSMVTSYVGKPLNIFNFPLNYSEQFINIIDDVNSVGIGHGDIYKTCTGLTIKKARIGCEKSNQKTRGGNMSSWYKK